MGKTLATTHGHAWFQLAHMGSIFELHTGKNGPHFMGLVWVALLYGLLMEKACATACGHYLYWPQLGATEFLILLLRRSCCDSTFQVYIARLLEGC